MPHRLPVRRPKAPRRPPQPQHKELRPMAWKLVSMERTDEEKLDTMATCAPALKDQPDFPWGLCISLDESSLKKLEAQGGLEGMPEVGDYIDMRCFACVKSVSQDKAGDGTTNRRVELQIEQIALENENTEESPDRPRYGRR